MRTRRRGAGADKDGNRDNVIMMGIRREEEGKCGKDGNRDNV